MRKQLFVGETDPKSIKDSLESECIDIQENYKYVKPFSASEEADEKTAVADSMLNKSRLQNKINEITEPLKEEMKVIKSDLNQRVNNLDQGGITTHGKVYFFPEYSDGLMGIYNEQGILVDTRPLNRSERQLHINSQLNTAQNE